MSEPDLLIASERVALGPLRPDLAELYGRWVNQREVRFGLEYLAVATPETERSRQAAMSGGERADVVLMDAIPAGFGASAIAP